MKKILFIIILIVFVSASISTVFAMTEIKMIPQPIVSVVSVEGGAQIKKVDSDNWISLSKNEILTTGDMIKTFDDSKVSVNFYDNTVSHVGPNSEIIFDELFIDQENYAKTKVGLGVTVGRVWSRIIQLMDKDAVFEVSSSATVATVRGTVFDFEVTNEGIVNVYSVENIIEVATVKNREKVDETTKQKIKEKEIINKINLPQGLAAIVDQKKDAKELEEIITEIVPEKIKQGVWFEENKKADEQFTEEIKKKQEEVIKEIAGILPDSGLYKIKRIVEKTKTAMIIDPEEKQELAIAFANRRLAEAQQLNKVGKKAMVEEVFQEFQQTTEQLFGNQKNLIEAGVSQEKINKLQNQVENQINLQKRLMEEITPEKSAHELKIKVEAWQIGATVEEKEKEFLQLKQIEERLGELKILKELGEEEFYEKYFDEYKEKIDSIQQLEDYDGLIEKINLEKEIIEDMPQKTEEITEEDVFIKTEKEAIEEIEEKINIDTEVQKDELISQTEIPQDYFVPTEKIEQDVLQLPDSSVSELNTIKDVTKQLSKLVIRADNDKYNMLTGETKQFIALAYYSDGSTKDVTDQVVWSISGDIGSISKFGLLQADSDGGKSVVSASFSELGITVSVSSPEITALMLIY